MKRTIQLLLAVIMLLSLAACAKAPVAADADETPTWQSQYDLGVRYLSEGKYEEAILAFNAAIEIDPKNPDAYIKLAEAYEQTGDDEAALRALQAGAEASHDSSLGLLAERKQKELDKANEPAVTPAAEPEEPTEPEEPETPAEPDWPAQLAGIRYFGDVSNCHMSREAAEAYAAVLEQMPWTREGHGTSPSGPLEYTLKAALMDPGDGYPLLIVSYSGTNEYGWEFTGLFSDDPTYSRRAYQVWTYDGNQAVAYDFLGDVQMQYIRNIGFGTLDEQPGIYVLETDGGGGIDWPHAFLYYTVSRYQIKFQYRLRERLYIAHRTAEAADGTDVKLVQDYLDEGWEITYEGDNGYCEIARYELDGIKISKLEYEAMEARFQPDSSLECYSPDNIGGYLLGGWSDASTMCAALRGQ